MRKSLIAVGGIATVLVLAPIVSAGGPNGGWGKGLLSSTLLFFVGSAETPMGFMYWSPVTDNFVYDFHGYELEAGTTYHLVCYEYGTGGEPDREECENLGEAVPCLDYAGVHIKGIFEGWPELNDAKFCLVPQSWIDGGDWLPTEWLLSEGLMWPS